MAGNSVDEVARRAGVAPDYVHRLVELGILTRGDGFSPGDVLRTRWVESLERSGVPVEEMAAAVRDGFRFPSWTCPRSTSSRGSPTRPFTS